MLVFRLPRKVFTHLNSGRSFGSRPAATIDLGAHPLDVTFRKQSKPSKTTSREEASAALAQSLVASEVKPLTGKSFTRRGWQLLLIDIAATIDTLFSGPRPALPPLSPPPKNESSSCTLRSRQSSIFFDDQSGHLKPASAVAPSVHIPFGVTNQPQTYAEP